MAANPRVPVDWAARKERFRAYMKAFNPNAPAVEPIESGLVTADLHDSLFEKIAAYFVDEEPSADVARRFGYSPGAFRVICYQFRHDPQKRAAFFRLPQRGPQSSPARDRVRDLAVAMRKRNLSVYDMQRELAAAGHIISINSLTILLREEGFSRLPRRADDERPVTVKPETAFQGLSTLRPVRADYSARLKSATGRSGAYADTSCTC